MEISFEISEEELPVYLAETDEQLQLLDEGLLQLEKEGESIELLQALFRAAHTLKGAAGMIAHKRMVSLTHALETAFDGLRKETYKTTPEIMNLCFEAIDALRLLREEVVSNRISDVNIDQLTDQFSDIVLVSTDTSPATIKPSVSQTDTSTQSWHSGNFHIKADISPTSIASAARAFQILLALQELGTITAMDPDEDYIDSAKPVEQFNIDFQTDITKEEILSVLTDISEIDKLTVDSISKESFESTTEASIQTSQQDVRKEDEKSPVSVQTVEKKTASPSRFAADKTVRTSVERLDNLMNLVGELITDRNRLFQIKNHFEARFHGDEIVDNLNQTATHINRITEELQSEVMGIRMVPIANVFNKFPRMVRDLANKLNKNINFVIEGEDTELDRSLIELINDPIIHLLRNAIDHGIETPEDRKALNKSEQAHILLSARYEQGRIIITIEDDGRGIDPQKIKQKAIQKGFISETDAAAIHDEEAVNLIFYSGFSTAVELSDVSGRGVGLDIVRNNIQRINGSLSVESRKNQGTRFEITLPLTLMIIQTLLVRIGNNRLAVPLPSINQSLTFNQNEIKTINKRPVIVFMDKVLPLMRLTEVFDFRSEICEEDYKYIVIVSSGKQQMGILVDQLLGEEEVVVKSLGSLIGGVDGISSAAILGDGQVVLILDVPDLFNLAGISQFKH